MPKPDYHSYQAKISAYSSYRECMMLWATSLHLNIDSLAVFLYIMFMAANNSYFIREHTTDNSYRHSSIHYNSCSLMLYLNTLNRFFFYSK